MWREITSIQQLDDIIAESQNNKVAIFKHSTSCGISRMVLRNFKSDIDSAVNNKTIVYYLDLLSYRSISNAIAEKFGVIHESPQLIVIENGSVKHNSSHHSINATQVIS